MPRGGARPGAGRKPGTRNRRSQAAIEEASKTGLMPLDFFLEVMRDTKESNNLRMEAAKSAAPYLHARLTAIAVSADDGPSTVEELTDAQLLAIVAGE